jgi:hypothetical protein
MARLTQFKGLFAKADAAERQVMAQIALRQAHRAHLGIVEAPRNSRGSDR